jgi:hypothetical protein
LLDDIRIRIRNRILEAQKHTNPTDPDLVVPLVLESWWCYLAWSYLLAYKSASSGWLHWNKQFCGSGAFLIPGFGMDTNPDPASGMNILDNFYESLEKVFSVKNT